MKQLKIGASLLAPRAAQGGWRHPQAGSFIQQPLTYFTEVMQIAEQGKLDFMFLPDYYHIFATTPEELTAHSNVWLEPVTLLAAMSAVTTRIGLVATLSTTYHEPYHVARMIASLDQLSGGRAGWNIVTSRGETEAVNFSSGHRPTVAERDEHATQFIALVQALWRSWEPTAIVEDRLRGIFAHASQVHPVQHKGKWFAVEGPLNVAPSPQGAPVCMQAGKSPAFRARAVKNTEVLFTQLNDIQEAKAFYADVKQRATHPERVLILPGLQVIVGATEAEAQQKKQDYERFDTVTLRIAKLMGLDMSGLTLATPLPKQATKDNEIYQTVLKVAQQKGLKTIGELYDHLTAQNSHLTLVGTAEQIADTMTQWLNEEAADGFIFIPHLLPIAMTEFVQQVIPVLQQRGVFRADYEGATLREHLALPLTTI